MILERNLVYKGSNDRESVYDLQIPTDFNKKLVVFVHGYKGFKDWGAWNMVHKSFVQKGFGFAKLNLSHNGGTVVNSTDFPDLKAFGENRYTYEIADIEHCMDAIVEILEEKELDLESVHLIGHSRGGGDVILAGCKMEVDSIITWAGISSIVKRTPKIGSPEAGKWKKDGVRYVLNGRTNQKMPHFYSMLEDVIENEDLLDIQKACQDSEMPMLHIHGDLDEAIMLSEGEDLSKWSGGDLKVISGANHTFGAKHPWNSNELPINLKEVVDLTIEFLLGE